MPSSSVLKRCCGSLLRAIFRVKTTPEEAQQHLPSTGDLSKCLTTTDLTHLGIGSILGAGIYVVSGQVAMNIAGPSVIISFTIAAVASLLSGLSYSEFASRVPNTTGSAYAYSYHTVGEFLAFLIGWNLILEYMIGTAADARALSGAIDYLAEHRLSNFSIQTFGYVPSLHTHADLVALLVTLVVTGVLAVGVKESARYTMLFNYLNGAVALLVVGFGALKAKPIYWQNVTDFFPNGAHGVFAGAASCFYAFVGFDIIATTGEEAKSASKSIPTAVILSLVICYSLYIGVSVIITMLIPFGTMQRSQSPLTEAFDRVGFHWAKWMIGCGAAFGLGASLLGSEFPLPRIIYAMSVDGLLFKCFRYVHTRTETPLWATIVPGILTGFFSLVFDLRELVEMMSIGTLLAYSLVCTSVMLLRYRVPTFASACGGWEHIPMTEEDTLHHNSTPPNGTRIHASVLSPAHFTSDNLDKEQAASSTKSDNMRSSFRSLSDEDDEEDIYSAPFANDSIKAPLLPASANSNNSVISVAKGLPEKNFTRRIPTSRSYMVVVVLTCVLWASATVFALLLLVIENHIIAEQTDPALVNSTLSGSVLLNSSIGLHSPAPKTLEKVVSGVVSEAWERLLWMGVGISGFCCALVTILIACQPQDWAGVSRLHFHVPLVPWLPACAIITNIFLMARLSRTTWIRFGVWLVLGLAIYFGYSVWNSEEGLKQHRARKQRNGRSTYHRNAESANWSPLREHLQEESDDAMETPTS